MQSGYSAYFGFTDKPFKLNPDPRFFYSNPSLEQIRADCAAGLQRRLPLLVITGPSGVGKSALLQLCRLQAPALCYISLNAPGALSTVLERIGNALSLPGALKPDSHFLSQWQTLIAEQAGQGKRLALHIEDAHNLEPDMLQALLDLSRSGQTGTPALLTLILTGLPELTALLQRHGVTPTLHCRLGELNEAEVNGFIQRQVQAAGYPGDGLFSPEAVARIAAYSAGLPRLINTLCEAALLSACRQQRTVITVDLIDEAARRCSLKGKPALATAATATATAELSPAPLPASTSSHRRYGHRWLWTGMAAATVVAAAAVGVVMGLSGPDGHTPTVLKLEAPLTAPEPPLPAAVPVPAVLPQPAIVPVNSPTTPRNIAPAPAPALAALAPAVIPAFEFEDSEVFVETRGSHRTVYDAIGRAQARRDAGE